VPKVYNSTGQIIPKDKIVSPNKKKEEVTQSNRVKSPKLITSPHNNVRVKSPAIEKREEIKKKLNEPPKKTVEHPPIVKKTHPSTTTPTSVKKT
jgi:hypothetical protein